MHPVTAYVDATRTQQLADFDLSTGFGALGLGDTQYRGDGPGEMGDNLPRIKLFSDAW